MLQWVHSRTKPSDSVFLQLGNLLYFLVPHIMPVQFSKIVKKSLSVHLGIFTNSWRPYILILNKIDYILMPGIVVQE